MYDIGIPEIRCTKRYEDKDGISIKYDAEAIERPTVCPKPHMKQDAGYMLHKHSSKTNLIRDTKSEGKLVYINLRINRYRCSACGAIIPDTFTFYDQKAHTTNRLRDEYVRRCIKGETFSYIANDYGVDHKTVAAAFKAYADAHVDELTYSYTPEILGIDEAHIDDHYRLVLTDIKEQRLLDIKKDNSPEVVRTYLRTLDKDICRCTTMDFAPEYASAVSDVLPDATIVIDKFHVVQEINSYLDKARRSIQNELKAQGVDIRRFKRSRYLFLANMESLDDDSCMTLSSWFKDYPCLYEAYMCKETFRDIYLVAKTYQEASIMYDKWLDAVPVSEIFRPMKRTMTFRREHILNYWHCKWTNAYTESINNLIKKIEKAGRGYKFSTLRKKCILEINHSKPVSFDPKTAEYLTVSEINERNKQKYNLLYPEDFSNAAGIDLKDRLLLYLEVNSLSRQKEAFLARMKTYHDRLMSMR